MGHVISFQAYKDHKKMVVMEEPCERPFHREEYVVGSHCYFCEVKVTSATHPSFEGSRWYG
jgi:hypothetical protein